MLESSLYILVKPKSSRNEVVRTPEGVLVRVSALPVEGAANSAVIKALSEAFALPKSRLAINAGASGKLKKISISGVSKDELDVLIAALPCDK